MTPQAQPQETGNICLFTAKRDNTLIITRTGTSSRNDIGFKTPGNDLQK